MRAEAKQWVRDEVRDAVERALTELEQHPVYFDDGEEVVLTMRLGFSRDRNRPWTEKPDTDGEGTYVNLQVTFARTECR